MVTKGEKGSLQYLLRKERINAGYYLVRELSVGAPLLVNRCFDGSYRVMPVENIEQVEDSMHLAPYDSFQVEMIKAVKFDDNPKIEGRHYTRKMSKQELLEKLPEFDWWVNRELESWMKKYERKRVWCLHCEKTFIPSKVKFILCVYGKPRGLIETVGLICPNSGCDGNPLDWHFPREGVEYEKSLNS